jgi:AcrR family transcriptional regulator
MARVATKAAQNGQKRHKAKVRQRRVRHSAAVGKENSAATRAGARAQASAARREAILAAALDEFSARGFAATRLDDVARRAEVAKGTIYLHFADKETLFQEIIHQELSPVVGALEEVSHTDVPIQKLAGMLVEVFVREIFETRRKDVIRLIITEGPRFPKLAEFYYREVIAHVMEAVRAMLRRAVERGELAHDALVRFPQLLAAPGMVAIVWSGLFDHFEPLDVRAMLRAHFEILFGRGGAA